MTDPIAADGLNDDAAPSRALVLHGVWNPRLMVWPVVRHLRRNGIDAAAFGYSSIFADPRSALPHLRRTIVDRQITSLVGYSLGGVLSLLAVRDWADCPVRRVVCLGSPLNGSGTARWLQTHRCTAVLGGSAGVLCEGLIEAGDLPPGLQVGMVAGIQPLGIGRLLGAQGRRSDGTVSLRETRWPGLADHCRVRCSHTALPAHGPALDQIRAFLITGSFGRPALPATSIG